MFTCHDTEEILAVPKRKTGLGKDQRLFIICPNCKSTAINFIRKWMRIVSYLDNKKIGEVHVIDHSFAVTMCSKCGYSKNGSRTGKNGISK